MTKLGTGLARKQSKKPGQAKTGELLPGILGRRDKSPGITIFERRDLVGTALARKMGRRYGSAGRLKFLACVESYV